MEHTMEIDNGASGKQIIDADLPKIQDPITCLSLRLGEYIDRYSGYTKLQRLIFIAERCSNLQEDAYRRLLIELKKGSNTSLYMKTHALVGAALGLGSDIDVEWVETVERRESIKLERLEAELMAAKTTVVKESIRLSFNDIGDLYYERGNLGESLKSYLRTKDYCTIPKHNLELCVRVISVSMDLQQFGNVNIYITKDESTPGDVAITAKIKSAAALVLLIEGQYKRAAKKFLEVGWDLGSTFSSIIAAEDIAIYGTLCALATLDRSEIRKSALENSVFKSFLELVPDVKLLLTNFFAGKYGECLSCLERVQAELLLDLHLSKHVKPLIAMINERIILLYFSPYSSVDMHRMAATLNMNLPDLEKAVATLISNDKIAARIDSQSKTLHRRQHDVRSVTMEKIEKLSLKHIREVKRGILRLSVMQHGFQVMNRDANALARGGINATGGSAGASTLVLGSSSSSASASSGGGSGGGGGNTDRDQQPIRKTSAGSVEDHSDDRMQIGDDITGGGVGVHSYIGDIVDIEGEDDDENDD